MIILLVQFLIFISFVFYIYKKCGILPSISNSWYKLPENRRELFSLFCLSIGLLMIFHGGIFFFISAAGLTFTSAATQYENKNSRIIHYVGAGTSILSALLGLYFEFSLILPIIIFLLFSIPLFLVKIKNYLWWIEIVSFLTIMSGLLFMYIS